jgi:hypothetical protein
MISHIIKTAKNELTPVTFSKVLYLLACSLFASLIFTMFIGYVIPDISWWSAT